MKRKDKRSICPLSCTLDLLGDKWTLLVIRDLFAGKSHFKEFLESPERIATNILTDRLNHLLGHELVERRPSTRIPGRRAYRLTHKGESLRPVLQAIADWGLAHIAGTKMHIQPQR